MDDKYRRMGLVYFVTSSLGFIRSRNKHKLWEIAKSIHFFPSFQSLWAMSMCKALPFSYTFVVFCCYIQMQYTNQASCWEKESSLSAWACFAREWSTEVTSQSKLRPFSFVVIHGRKKRPTSLLWKHPKEKSIAKNFLVKVIRAVSKVYLSEKKNVRGRWHSKGNTPHS